MLCVKNPSLKNDILILVTYFDKICWPLNIIRNEAQIKLKRKCLIINIFMSCFFLHVASTFTVNAPYFGDQRDFFISIRVFEEYFGEWSYIPYYFYFVGFPFLYYHFLKLCLIFVYVSLQSQLQFFIVEEYLFETHQTDDLKRWKYLEDAQYQREIGKSLRLCITHHNALKKLVKLMMNVVLTVMPFFLLLGVFLFISCFAFIINFSDTMTNILKIRISMYAVTVVCTTIMLCWNGQQLIDVTSKIFYVLSGAPWYYWNLKNIKTFLIFMTNCTKNEGITLAGFCIDYNLFVSMVRVSVSYALVLYNFRKSSLI
ncbi:uncharacterized protein LOC123006510 [Tribolium madens]|uniref:uncharacterized protein LOC123006510 n=1 Tax=Tribolium madens TaxID=41895 RepID=UPI001CF74387|nr:uncharacterized protein LOC123006510 [Tribolium madens]